MEISRAVIDNRKLAQGLIEANRSMHPPLTSLLFKQELGAVTLEELANFLLRQANGGKVKVCRTAVTLLGLLGNQANLNRTLAPSLEQRILTVLTNVLEGSVQLDVC